MSVGTKNIEELENIEYGIMDVLEAVNHWLLIVNSSCNILIYLYKDPQFKVLQIICGQQPNYVYNYTDKSCPV